MNIDKIRVKSRRSRKTKIRNIRISPEISEWMRQKGYSPTGIFYEALRELGCPFVKE